MRVEVVVAAPVEGPWVTVTVTVVVDSVRVLVREVRSVVVCECRLRGGATVTVLDVVEREHTPGTGAMSQAP